MDDPFNLQRFVDAQKPVYDHVYRELRAGEKRSHWMWFIFPQMRGLGHSEMAVHYGIASQAEAEAYLAHPVLGPRLRECTELVCEVRGRSIRQILGSPDDMKFRSSMTLFARVSGGDVFEQALGKYCDGVEDPRTIELLQAT